MEDLFLMVLATNNIQVDYHIIFKEEAYHFIPTDSGFATYSFKREHDEWHAADEESEKVKDDAVEALDKYLLRQH